MFVPLVLMRHAKDRTRSNVYLGMFFVTMSIYPLYRSVLVNIASEEFLGIFLPILMPIFMLSGSILYLYVKNNLADQPHKLSWWKDGIHFIPSLISLVNLFP